MSEMVYYSNPQITTTLQKRGDLAVDVDTSVTLSIKNFDIAVSFMYVGETENIQEHIEEYFSF